MLDDSFRVLLGNATAPNPHDPLQEELRASGCALLFAGNIQGAELSEDARVADAMVAGRSVSTAMVDQLERCRVIVRTGIGYDTIDVAAATRRGILVVNVPDSWTEEVANHTMTLLLAAHRNLLSLARYVRDGNWSKAGIARPYDNIHRLSSQTLGILGLGNIGRAVASRAQAFGLAVVACDPYVDATAAADQGVELLPFDDLLARSDYVSVHTPLTEATRHLLGPRELSLMKPTAIVINTARGGVIDEAALAEALRERRIRGAALDVVEHEPLLDDHPFLGLDNVVLTPHAAYYSDEAVAWCLRQAAREITSIKEGGLPRRVAVVNKELLPAG